MRSFKIRKQTRPASEPRLTRSTLENIDKLKVKKFSVAKSVDKLKLILDLDEFLVHTYYVMVSEFGSWNKTLLLKLKPPCKEAVQNHGKSIKSDYGDINIQVKYIERPGLRRFLEELGKLDIEVIFWTASQRAYADAVFNSILPESLIRCARLYRADCERLKRPNGSFSHYKDLTKKFTDEQLAKVIIYDDNRGNFRTSEANGIEIPRWIGDLTKEPGDPLLLDMLLEVTSKMIDHISKGKDVRDVSKGLEKELQDKIRDTPTMQKNMPQKSRRGSFVTIASTFFKALST